jgi:selenocysteine lyase/cysteine desulfurase
MNIDKIRKDTLHCEDFIHFNNAGAALPTRYVNEAIISFLQEEEVTGGYEMEAKYAESIDQIYTEIARLIKGGSDEIAITDNASTAFSKALYSIPFQEGDEIITSEIEYSSNFLNYLKLKREKGINIVTIPMAENGPVDVQKLEKAISNKTKLVAMTHMPTSSGAIAPVKEIGELTKASGILYLVDTCQSIGHYPTFVDELHCDFLTGTSRKYIRGPRGLGFLYARKSIYKDLDPFMLEAMGANWKSTERYELNYTSKMFEAFEKPYAFMMGLQEAVRYANNLGIEEIWSRIQGLSTYARSLFVQNRDISLHDGNGDELSGIITLTIKNKDSLEVQRELSEHKVNISVCKPFTSLTDMQSKGLDSSCRLSLHYYNTREEIERVNDILQNIK